ncbi:MAG: SDR family NAD(P)-dependent oxidoreductase [Methanomicrobium sp.]|nr:SDR family NAD(P)-dependent oxidoreductase [Methanomicrobium sp.]
MTDNDYFKDKICIVTGANSGIGYAISAEILKRGGIVYLAGRSPGKIAKAKDDFSIYGDRARELIMDVSVQKDVEIGISGVSEEAGRIDILFNNAGVGGTIPFDKATYDDWKKIIDVNLWSVIYGVSEAVPHMLKQGSGHIVNTGSIAGIVPPPFQALYSLTKYGVTGMTECLKYEYAEKGLFFSVICPANIATAIFNKGVDGVARGELRLPDDAYPADKAASYILDRVSEKKGIIIVPEEPYTEMWKGYVLGSNEVEEHLFKMAHERREAFENKGSYF